MSFLTELKDAAKSSSASHISILQQYKKKEKSIHLFFEGKDDPSFYTNYIENRIEKDCKVFFYNCKNKKGVYENYKKLDWRTYKKYRVLFFVDKDHDDLLRIKLPVDNNIFVTKYYSIENYLVNNQILRRILRELIGITDENSIRRIVRSFEKELLKYSNKMIIVTSWILLHRKLKTNPNLNNINISHLFKFEGLEIKRIKKPQSKSTKKYLDSKTKVNTPAKSWPRIKDILNKIKIIPEYKTHLRGKFEMWFMIVFIDNLLEKLNEGKQKGQTKLKLKVPLSISNSVAILGTRLKIPEELKSFLETNLEKV